MAKGFERNPDRYEERVCPVCGEGRMVRKDVKTSTCHPCAIRTRGKLNIKNPSPRHDPEKVGSWKSYWQAKRRAAGKGSSPEHYETVEFLFENFDQWWEELGPKPDGCSVDRIDPRGNYEPGNVRWATHKEQCNNRNRRRWFRKPEGS